MEVRDQFLVDTRTSQVSRAWPLSWAHDITLVLRMWQSTFPKGAVLVQALIGDPIVVVRGSASGCDRFAATFAVTWLALGLLLATAKAQFSLSVKWFGAVIARHGDRVGVSVQESTLQEVLDIITRCYFLEEVWAASRRARACASFGLSMRSWPQPCIGPRSVPWQG